MRYAYPTDYAVDGEWSGAPSIAWGVLERCAHEMRRRSGVKYARLLYTAAGHRQKGEWGALALELNGRTYHFGAGMKRYPHLIGPDRHLSESGYKLLATGLVGEVSCDTLEWHWLHDQTDITYLFSDASLALLEQQWESLLRGDTPTPIFQTKPYTLQYGIAQREDGLNCTRIQARMIGPLIGIPDLDEDLPLRLFHTFLDLRFKAAWIWEHDFDKLHKQWIEYWGEDICRLLPSGISDADYRMIAKSCTPLPDHLVEWYMNGP